MRFYLKMMLLSIVLAPVLALIRGGVLEVVDASGPIGSLTVAAVVGAVFLALAIAAGFILKVAEITDPTRSLLHSLRLMP